VGGRGAREGRRGRKHDASRVRNELAGARRVVRAIPTMVRESEQRGGGGARGEREWKGVASEEEEVKRHASERVGGSVRRAVERPSYIITKKIKRGKQESAASHTSLPIRAARGP
jgi:hypothetical protein